MIEQVSTWRWKKRSLGVEIRTMQSQILTIQVSHRYNTATQARDGTVDIPLHSKESKIKDSGSNNIQNSQL